MFAVRFTVGELLLVADKPTIPPLAVPPMQVYGCLELREPMCTIQHRHLDYTT